jgi:hypothetical protein
MMKLPSLAETQREFFRALQLPLRGSSRRSTELPPSEEAHDPSFLNTAERLIRPSPALIPAECLELYHRQYWFRLLDSIEEDFPGVVRFLGKERFWEVVEAYLLRHSSQSFTLRHLGRVMPDFLAGCLDDPITRRRAIAIAQIEWAMMEAFEAAEGPSATPEQISEETITLQPHLILLEQKANASAWLHQDEDWSDDGTSHFHTAIWRTGEGAISHAPLEPGAFAMLARLAAAATTLDAWLEASEEDIPDPKMLTRWFSTWSGRGWFTSPKSNSPKL